MKTLRFGIAFACALSLSAQAGEPARGDFAYAYPVTAAAHAPFYRVELPAFLYETVTRPDLGDVRVFDRDGAVVPHVIRRQAHQEALRHARLPVFPVYADARTLGDDLSLLVQKDATGTIVKVNAAATNGGQRPVAFHLLDASQLRAPVHALQLKWSAGDVLGEVRIEASDDLSTWTRLSQSPVAQLAHDGHTLTQGRLAFSPWRARYLRLTWTQAASTASLHAAIAETRAPVERERQWVSLVPADADEPGSYAFTLRGAMPVDRARVTLPQPNTVVAASVHSRADSKAPWQTRGGGTISNTTDAALPDSELTMHPGAPASQWLLRIGQKDAGLGRGEPGLQLGWIPHELVFVARGAPPYTLAFGNAQAAPAAHGVEQLLAHAVKARIATAQLAPLATLRGEAALHASTRALDWRRLSLWAVLALGVAALGVMARRLLKELS